MVQSVQNNSAELDDLRRYVEQRFAEDPVEAALYASALDSDYKIDSKLLNDPVFLAFWKLQYLTFQEVVNPTPVNSEPGEISEVYLEDAYANSPDDMSEFDRVLAMTDAELAAFIQSKNQSGLESQTLLSALTTPSQSGGAVTRSGKSSTRYASMGGGSISGSEVAASGPQQNSMTHAADARDLGNKLGIGEDSIFWYMVETEEGINSAMANTLTSLSEMDQQMVDLTEALRSGAISAEQFEADSSNISVYRETMLAMLNQMSMSLMTITETISKMINTSQEGIRKNIDMWKI